MNLSHDGPILLCTHHYNFVYKQLNAPIKCVSCGAMPKTSTKFNRHSPDAHTITQYLKDRTDSESPVITFEDFICVACYKCIWQYSIMCKM